MVTSIREAEIRFLELVERAEAGEEIIISRAGMPVARLVPFDQKTADRRPGLLRGQVWASEDFDETPEEVLAQFEGEPDAGR